MTSQQSSMNNRGNLTELNFRGMDVLNNRFDSNGLPEGEGAGPLLFPRHHSCLSLA